MRTKLLLSLVVLVAAVGLIGCGSESVTNVSPTNNAGLKLVVNSSSNLTVLDESARLAPWNEGQPDSLTITSGTFLVRSIRFLNVNDYTVDTDISASDEARDQSDQLVPFQGPYVLQTNGSVEDLGDQTVNVGDYNALSLILHQGKSTDDLGTNTNMVGNSVVVTGYVWYGNNAEQFSFTLDLKTEILVRGDFAVPSTGNPEFVLEFDVNKWFRYGDTWLNPNDPENLPQIYGNIQKYIQGGRDYNGNGSIGD